jgi:hypothetical protein
VWLRNTAPGSSDGSAAPSRQGFQFQVAYSSCHKHIRHNVARVLLQDNANYKATQEEEEALLFFACSPFNNSIKTAQSYSQIYCTDMLCENISCAAIQARKESRAGSSQAGASC